jgi:GxxExxY protein
MPFVEMDYNWLRNRQIFLRFLQSKGGAMGIRDEKVIMEQCDRIRQTAFDLHAYLRFGHLEKVYENGLVHRLRKAGFNVEQQKPVLVYDEDGTVIGDYFVDLFVDGYLVVELKACKVLSNEHVAQTLGYLRATKSRDAMLINFGSPKIEIRKLVL